MIKIIIKWLRKSELGASLLEFAIVIPILLTMIMGLIEFGWVFNGYITLTGAAREGARLAVVGKESEIQGVIERHASTFQNLDHSVTKVDAGDQIIVTVNGDLPTLIGLFFADNLSMSTSANMRFETLGTEN